MLKTEQYFEADQEIIDFFKKAEEEFIFAIDLKCIFQFNTKQKKLITIKKIADNYAVLLNAELLVTVNESYFDKLDYNIRTILFEQELDKIHINMEKGTFSLVQPSLKTSTGIIKKHSYEKVERANETERLLSKNREDGDEE